MIHDDAGSSAVVGAITNRWEVYLATSVPRLTFERTSAVGTFTVSLDHGFDMTAGGTGADAGTDTDANEPTDGPGVGGRDDDPDESPINESDDGEPALALERNVIVVCLVGTIVGSTLPWISVSDATVYGFETLGLATMTIAAAAGGLVYSLEWTRRVMAATFVAGALIASIALASVPFGGIGSFVTLVAGVVLAFTSLVGYDKRR